MNSECDRNPLAPLSLRGDETHYSDPRSQYLQFYRKCIRNAGVKGSQSLSGKKKRIKPIEEVRYT